MDAGLSVANAGFATGGNCAPKRAIQPRRGAGQIGLRPRDVNELKGSFPLGCRLQARALKRLMTNKCLREQPRCEKPALEATCNTRIVAVLHLQQLALFSGLKCPAPAATEKARTT